MLVDSVMNGGVRSETLAVSGARPFERLDVFLQQEYPGVSRSALARLIREGLVRVDGRMVKPSYQPRPGERVTVTWPEPRPAIPAPAPMALEVLYEDETLLVLNKPAGLLVHPGAGTLGVTLVNALLYHCQGALSGIGGVARPGIVHRLDRDTSGLMVVAKNDAGHLALSEQFAQRGVVKVYHAIVVGRLAVEAGEINVPIARHPNHKKMMAVVAGGRSAVTLFRVLERLSGATLVEARPRTGRTHQIRVHFKHAGHPLVGDDLYGHRLNARLSEETGYVPPRHMLHAHRLAFVHPISRRAVSFEAPWPSDFVEAVEALRARPRP